GTRKQAHCWHGTFQGSNHPRRTGLFGVGGSGRQEDRRAYTPGSHGPHATDRRGRGPHLAEAVVFAFETDPSKSGKADRPRNRRGFGVSSRTAAITSTTRSALHARDSR